MSETGKTGRRLNKDVVPTAIELQPQPTWSSGVCMATELSHLTPKEPGYSLPTDCGLPRGGERPLLSSKGNALEKSEAVNSQYSCAILLHCTNTDHFGQGPIITTITTGALP